MGRRNGKKQVRDDTYTKIFAIFKCQSLDCGKQWTSYHGWKTMSNYNEICGSCSNNSKGRVTNIEEKMTELDVFVCQPCNKVSYFLPSGDTGDTSTSDSKPCLKCPNNAERTGKQDRYGKTVTFVCPSKACGKSWASIFFGKEYTQSCRSCSNKGKFIGKQEVDPNDPQQKQRSRKPWWMTQSGQHDVDNCDMCQELKALGRTNTCRGSKKIEIVERVLEDGRLDSNVKFTSGRPSLPKNY